MNASGEKISVVLLGEEGAGLGALRALSSAGCEIRGVFATPDGSAVSLWSAAQKMRIASFPSESIKDPSTVGMVAELRPDLLLNVHSLHVIPGELLVLARIGALNLHPGPLPRYAGLNSPSWAIYHGEAEHGVTLHWMTPRIDAGEIAYQKKFAIDETDTGYSLSVKCVREGIRLIKELLRDAQGGVIPRTVQDLSQRSYFGAGPPQGGVIDWNRRAREVFNFVRSACFDPFPSPWGHPKSYRSGEEIGMVTAASLGEPTRLKPGTVSHHVGSGAAIACADQVLVIQKVSVGGTDAAAAEALRVGEELTEQA